MYEEFLGKVSILGKYTDEEGIMGFGGRKKLVNKRPSEKSL